MKHSIVILAHHETEHLLRLTSYFGPECDIYVHFDKKSTVSKQFLDEVRSIPNVKGVYREYAVHWGGRSMLRCELYMIGKVLENGVPDYLHLLSGQDYPTRPYRWFLDFFKANQGTDYIHCEPFPNESWDHNSFSRLQYYHVNDYFRDPIRIKKWNHRLRRLQDKLHIRRKYPVFTHLYGGSQWFSLQGKTAASLLAYTLKNKRFLRSMKHTFASDEIYFQTLLMNIQEDRHVVPVNKRFIRWKDENGNCPANLGLEHFRLLIENDCLFARKFVKGISDALVSLMDRYLVSPDKPLEVMSTGGWNYDGYLKYGYSSDFAEGVSRLCLQLGIRTVVDAGCGSGIYVAVLREKGLHVTGFDANPFTPELSAHLLDEGDDPCVCADLTDRLESVSPADMVICRDVLPYIPADRRDAAVGNLRKLSARYLLISWTDVLDDDDNPGCEPRQDDDVAAYMSRFGFVLNPELTQLLRSQMQGADDNPYYFFTMS